MANTYTQLSLHVIFAVKYRHALITKEWRDDLHKYLSGIVKNSNATPLAVGGWLDHVHVFCGFPTEITVSDFVQKLKISSSTWINEQKFIRNKFHWQKGYGGFTYARTERDRVIKYIMNQENHHKKVSFKNEYIRILKNFEVDFDEKYLFDFFE